MNLQYWQWKGWLLDGFMAAVAATCLPYGEHRSASPNPVLPPECSLQGWPCSAGWSNHALHSFQVRNFHDISILLCQVVIAYDCFMFIAITCNHQPCSPTFCQLADFAGYLWAEEFQRIFSSEFGWWFCNLVDERMERPCVQGGSEIQKHQTRPGKRLHNYMENHRGWDWCPDSWGFVSHHQNSHICWKLYPLGSWVMWNITGHRNQPLSNAQLQKPSFMPPMSMLRIRCCFSVSISSWWLRNPTFLGDMDQRHVYYKPQGIYNIWI